MSGYSEKGIVFKSGNNRLIGVVAVPEDHCDVAVLIMVGGPQYRVGSHRQFTLLARSLAEAGIASVRFDYSGMGDSEGDKCSFHEVESDVAAAVDNLCEYAPGVTRVVLWGLCDAASAALLFAYREPRVAGMVLLNPWVHSGEYSPEVKFSQYYSKLLRDRNTWRRLFSGDIEVMLFLKEFAREVGSLVKKVIGQSFGVPVSHSWVTDMLEGLKRFKGSTLIILSEKDLTAQEFQSLIVNDKSWRKAIVQSGAVLHNIARADHTFSNVEWQDEVVRVTIDQVKRQSKTGG